VRNFLLSNDLARSDIGIVTPYSGQVRYFYDQFRLDPLFLTGSDKDVKEEGEYADTQLEGGLNIASVDGFQGREKEVILFSTVRANNKGKVGFLSDWRRLNVAITRARRGLIIVGDKTTLMNDPHWAAWINWVDSIGAIRNVEDFNFPTPSDETQNNLIKEENIQQDIHGENNKNQQNGEHKSSDINMQDLTESNKSQQDIQSLEININHPDNQNGDNNNNQQNGEHKSPDINMQDPPKEENTQHLQNGESLKQQDLNNQIQNLHLSKSPSQLEKGIHNSYI
jgi:hypothetical protein